MTSSSGVAMMHFGAVDETTKRLVSRCVKVPWLQEGEEKLERQMGKRLTIGSNAKAAESSLSVLEVAAHKEKPGVQTPSRGKEEREGHEGNEDIEDKSVGNGVKISVDKSETVDSLELKSPFEVEEEV